MPADSELPPATADFRELFARPAQQTQWARLQAARAQHRQRPRTVSRAPRRRIAARPGRALIVFGLVLIFVNIPHANIIYAVPGIVIFGGQLFGSERN